MNEPHAGTKTPWETVWETVWETRGDGMLLTPKQYAMLAAAYARPRSDVSLEMAAGATTTGEEPRGTVATGAEGKPQGAVPGGPMRSPQGSYDPT
jgi:hypothetical protein